MTSQVPFKLTWQVDLPTQPFNTDGRTDELTKNSKTNRDTSSSDTCAHVQDFDDLEMANIEAARIEAEKKLTAAREPEPTREIRDAAGVVASHLTEEKAV